MLAQGVPAFTPATTFDADLKDLSLVMDHNMSVASFNAAPAYLPKPAPAKVSSNLPASLMQNGLGWCLIFGSMGESGGCSVQVQMGTSAVYV